MGGSNLTSLELEHFTQLLPGKELLWSVTFTSLNLEIFLKPNPSWCFTFSSWWFLLTSIAGAVVLVQKYSSSSASQHVTRNTWPFKKKPRSAVLVHYVLTLVWVKGWGAAEVFLKHVISRICMTTQGILWFNCERKHPDYLKYFFSPTPSVRNGKKYFEAMISKLPVNGTCDGNLRMAIEYKAVLQSGSSLSDVPDHSRI